MISRRFAIAAALLALTVLAGCKNSAPASYQGWIEANLIFVGPDEAGRIETLSVREVLEQVLGHLVESVCVTAGK